MGGRETSNISVDLPLKSPKIVRPKSVSHSKTISTYRHNHPKPNDYNQGGVKMTSQTPEAKRLGGQGVTQNHCQPDIEVTVSLRI